MIMKTSLNRDPILLDIEIDPLGTAILDLPMCQRLRRINQLGFTDLVFDGARHSRLSHMKGVYFRVQQLFEAISKNHNRLGLKHPGEYLDTAWGPLPEIRWSNCAIVCSWAGLLHDVTHIPIGHTLEDEFSGLYTQHDSLLCPRHANLWGLSRQPEEETIKSRLFALADLIPKSLPVPLQDPLTLARLLHVIIMHKESRGIPFETKITDSIDQLSQTQDSETQKNFLADLFGDYSHFKQNKLYHPFMTDIITDTICADLLDYLQRDTYFTGLLETYDPRILKAFVLVAEGNQLRMAVAVGSKSKPKRIDIMTDVVNLMKLRQDLALKVYYHKTKVVAGAMLVRAIDLLGHHPVDGAQSDENSITHFTMTDEGLLGWLRSKAKHVIKSDKTSEGKKNATYSLELLDSILLRRLFKVLLALPYEGFWSKIDPHGEEVFSLRSKRHSLCQDIATEAGCSPHEIIIFIPPFKDKAKEVEARALRHDDSIVALGEHEDLQRDIALLNANYQKLWKLYVFVHPGLSGDQVKCSKIADSVKKVLNKELPSGRKLSKHFVDHVSIRYLDTNARARLKELQMYPFDSSEESQDLYHFVTDSELWGNFIHDHNLSGKKAIDVLIYRRLLEELVKLDNQSLFPTETIILEFMDNHTPMVAARGSSTLVRQIGAQVAPFKAFLDKKGR